ncbi:MAG: ATP-binding cassette domain-containing protein [Rhodospirillaceae bacterium]|nr:ATP-binding cassette domain-containing protein [Rhodospirillaceae bacterium]
MALPDLSAASPLPGTRPVVPVSTGVLYRRLLREAVAPYAGRFALASLCMVAVAVSTAALAWLMDPVVNQVFVERRAELLWPVGLAVFATFAVKGIGAYGQTVIMTRVGQTVLTDLQNRLFRHLLEMDLTFFAAHRTGTLISRLTTDIAAMRTAVSTALTGLGREALSIVFLVGVMFYQDWLLAAVASVAFPATVIPISGLGRRLRTMTANTQTQTGAFMTLVDQCLNGIRLVKAYRMEDYENARARRLTTDIRDRVIAAERVKALASPLMETLGGVAVTIVIVYGGWRVIGGETTAGAFFSFITALLSAYRPMKALANANASVNEGLAGAERLFAVLDTKPALHEKPGAVVLRVTRGEVCFENVTFSYGGALEALKGVSFTAQPGKTTALVGPSGAGKTTVLNLIPRFYDITSGSITIDGRNIADVTLASLRDAVALVSQDVVLFDDSVRANIRYGRAGASDTDVEEAARAAGAYEFISALPEGFETAVGERGQTLSGGQRQRIAIARALLKDAPILLLDEATSALDAETERQVQSALERLKQGRTTLVIAHRLATVATADQICVIDQGRVAEQGAHGTLLSKGGLYARLHALQGSPGMAAG